MANIEPRVSRTGEESWAVKWREGGRRTDPPRTRTLMIETHAERLKELIVLAGQRWPTDAQLRAHGLPYLADAVEPDAPTDLTVADMVTAYLDAHERRPKAPAPRSMKQYRRNARLYVAPTRLGKTPAADVTWSDVEDWQSVVASTIAPGGRRPLGANTVNQVRQGVLAPAFKWACSKRGGNLLAANPCLDAEAFRPDHSYARPYLESPAEYAALLEAARAVDPWWADTVETAAATGMRFHELAGLRCGQVDLHRCMIHLPPGKNGRPRDIPVPVHVMVGRIAPRLTDDPDALVFTRRGKRWPYTTDTGRWVKIRPALVAAGITRTITHHSLRKGYATWLKSSVGGRAPIDADKVALVMGHKLKGMTGRHYTGLTPADHNVIRDAITALVAPAD